MNIIKKICIITFLIFISCGIFAQAKYKVKESSSKKVPEWSGGMLKEYIITSAISKDIEHAKEICMRDVTRLIIEAVALNVKTSSESTISETVVNNKIEGSLDEFESSVKTQSANIPYMNSISYSKVEDYYWEQRMDKKTKEQTYYYTIKYPFSNFDLIRIVDAFTEQDQLMESKFTRLEEGYTNISSIEEISDAINNLKTLDEYFFDDVRKNKVKALIQNYRGIYNKVAIRRVSDQVGNEEYGLAYGDRLLSYSKPPRLSSNTAFELSSNKKDSIWKVEYNYSTCYPEEENYINITWMVGSKNLKEKFLIKLEKEAKSIQATGKVNLNLQKSDDNSIIALELTMNIESFDNKQYTIQKIQLNNEYFTSTVVFDNIGYVITHKGVHSIHSTINKWFVLSENSKRMNASITKGSVTFIDDKENVKTVNYSLFLNKNW